MEVHRSIRTYLLLLMLAVTVPLAGLLGYTIFANGQHELKDAREITLSLARLAAASTQRFLTDAADLVAPIARRPLVRAANPAACDPFLVDFHDLATQFTNIGVANLAGQVICSAAPQPGRQAVSVAETRWFQRVVQSDASVVGEPVISPITGQWVSMLAYPLHDDREQLAGVLGVGIDLVGYRFLPGDSSLPDGAVITLVDADGTIVARSHDPEQWVGRSARGAEIVDRVLAQAEGVAQARGADGVERVYGYTTIASVNWHVYAGIPTEVILVESQAAAVRNSLLLIVSGLAVVTLALFLARQIEHPIRAVAEAARAVARGQLETRAPVAGPAEVAEVALQFNRMLDVRAREEQALRDSEARYRRIVETAQEGIWQVDAEGRTTFANQALAEMLGYPVTELLGAPQLSLVADADRTIASTYMERRRKGIAERHEVKLRRKDGTDLWALVSASPIVDQAAHYVGALAMVSDITERKLAEAAERDQRLLAEALRDTAAALTSSLEPEVVMARVLENVGRVVPHDSANILLVEGDAARAIAWRGYPAPVEDFLRTYRFLLAALPNLAAMFSTGLPCLVADTASDPRWVNLNQAETRWIRSAVGVPIQVHAQVIGFLNLDSAEPGFFTATHAERLQAFAGQAAIALQNAQLFDRIRQDAVELAALHRATAFLYAPLTEANDLADLGHHIAQAVADEFGPAGCQVSLVDGEDHPWRLADAGYDETQPMAAGPMDSPGPLHDCIRTGQLIAVPDGWADPRNTGGGSRPGSILVVPLKTTQGVIGALAVSSQAANAFGESDRRLLTAFAERAAAAIYNMQLYEQIRRYTDELERRVRERTLALEAQQAQLDAILTAMAEGVVSWTAEPRGVMIHYANRAFCRLTGYDLEEMAEQPDFHRLLPSGQVQWAKLSAAVRDSLLTRDVWERDVRLRRKDGGEVDSRVTLTRLKGEHAGALGGVALVRDIGQEKALQAQKDRFIANAAHELRTPLATFKLILYLLRHQPHRLPEQLEVLERVTNQMQMLAEDLLDTSRFERGVWRLNRERVVMQDLIGHVLALQRPYAEHRAIRLVSDLPAPPVLAWVDASRVMQVLTNLVVNALNYTPSGGQVRVELSGGNSAEAVVVRVQDTGIGMAPDVLSHIFEPFFRANDGSIRGTGLGLTIAQEIVRAHGGTITVQSQEHVGTTFAVSLPLSAAEPERGPEGPGATVFRGG